MANAHVGHDTSFVVDPKRQSYRCQVCNEGGDCFSYLMRLDNVGFQAALGSLARRAALELPAAVPLATETSIEVTTQDKPLIAATMFGVTTPCAEHARKILEAAGYEVLVFHATGNGGEAMEGLIADGLIAGVLDITTTELADELVGGILTAGPTRLTAAGKRGVPQVISVGALDMVNYGPISPTTGLPYTVPEEFRNRKFYRHNPTVTLMRTTPEENRKLGVEIGTKAAAATGPTAILLPLQGVSAIDRTGQAFDDPTAREELFQAIRSTHGSVELIEMDNHINDAQFAEVAARKLLTMITIHPSH